MCNRSSIPRFICDFKPYLLYSVFMKSDLLLAIDAFEDQLTEDILPHRIKEEVINFQSYQENIPTMTVASLLLLDFWRNNWREQNPQKAAFIFRIDDMKTMIVNDFVPGTLNEKLARSHQWVEMEEPEYADGTYARYIETMNVYLVSKMAHFLTLNDREVPTEITDYLLDRGFGAGKERK